MDLKITPAAVAAFRDKDSKKERFRKLYEQMDFLPAYAEHTNLRVKDNPKGAIGREDEWESHGKMQLEFLIKEGMQPKHTLLDVGCGVGRASRRFVPYLSEGNYVGIDISQGALNHAIGLAADEGWAAKGPVFLINGDLAGLKAHGPFNFIWGHSVWTHLPTQQIEIMLGNAVDLMTETGKMLFTYKQAEKPRRTGLKQFGYNFDSLSEMASRHGLKAESHPKVWPAHQLTIRLTKAV